MDVSRRAIGIFQRNILKVGNIMTGQLKPVKNFGGARSLRRTIIAPPRPSIAGQIP